MRKPDINWHAEIAASFIGYLLGALLIPFFRGLGSIILFIFWYAIDDGQVRTDLYMPPLPELLVRICEYFSSFSGYMKTLESFGWKGLTLWVIGGLGWRVIAHKQERVSRWVFWAYAYAVCVLCAAVAGVRFGSGGWVFLYALMIVPAFALASGLVPFVRRVCLWLDETELESLFRRR